MSSKHIFARRELIIQGVKLSLGGAGLSMLGVDTLLPQANPVLTRVMKLLQLPSGLALAQADSAATPVIQICCIDKMSIPLIFPARGTINTGDLTGLDGTENYNGAPLGAATGANGTANWRGLDVTALWNNAISGIKDGYNLRFYTQFTSNSGGHSLQNADLSLEKGGLNYLIEKGAAKKGLLGPVGFAIRGDANNSRESFVAPGRTPMQTYDSVMNLRATLKASVAALSTSEESLAMRKSLDRLATQNDKAMANLLKIRDMINPVLDPLSAAAGDGDIVRQQLKAVIALAKAGIGSNFMIAIPWDDTNGGGNLTTEGGQAGISPMTGAAMLADVYKTLSSELPQAVTVLVSDGGRSANNGDAAAGLSIISGPATLVPETKVVGVIPQTQDLGNNGRVAQAGVDIPMSDGSNARVLEHKHLHALVLKLAHDITVDVAYPV